MLLPEIRALPGFRAERPYAMILTNNDCRYWIRESGTAQGALALVSEKQLSLLTVSPIKRPSLCLFRYLQPVPATQMRQAVDRNWQGTMRAAHDR